MATNITTEQRDGILKVIVGLFDAAPGGIYLNQFAADVQGGATNLQLANALANDPVFLNGILGGKVTSADKVNVLMKHYGLTADSNATSAGSQAKAYFESKLAAGQSMGQIVVDAGDYLSGTVPPEFQATKNLFLNKVAVAANYSLNSNATDLSTLQNSLSQVKGDHLYTAAEAQAIANEASANNLALTADADIIKGTAANDIITGTQTTTMQAGDQIDGGSGLDTLKVLGTVNGNTDFPGIITGVEALQIAKLNNAAFDLSAYTKAATGLTTIAISDATGFANTITTTAGQSLSLATANGAAAGAATWAGSATDTSLNLTLNGYQGDEAITPLGLTVTGAAATTLNIASIGADNVLASLVVNPVTKNIVITGDNKFTTSIDTSVLDKIDASANAAGVEITSTGVAAAAFAFTGGSGDDSLAVGVGGLGTITAGSQLDGGTGTDTLVTSEAAVLTAAQIAKINAVKGFEVLSFGATGSGVDVSTITNAGITQFKVNATVGVLPLSETFTNALSSSNFVIDNSNGNNGNVTIANKVGENATNITLDTGSSADPDELLDTLTLSGVTNVVLTSTGSADNVITNFLNSDNSVITIKGAAGLALATEATSTGSKVDGSAATGDLNIAGNTAAYASGSSLGDILIGGSGDDFLTASVNNGTLTGNAGNDTFDVNAALGGVDSITTITDFTKGDLIEFTSAGTFTTAKVDLSTATTQAGALNLLAAGAGTGGVLSWGVYGGNTYLVADNTAGATFAATDTAVKLTGTLDLSTSTLAADALTFA